jgi:nucleoside-diphosphate-sugar epimerase
VGGVLNMKNAVIFGGSGFIGTHLTQHFLQSGVAGNIYIADIKGLRNESYTGVLQHARLDGRVHFVECDVTNPTLASALPQNADLVVNLAAVHREPGHRAEEYFRTNLLGAENVTAYAKRVGCRRIVFTSSISPYGPSEELKDEGSLPVPETPYGSSKLAAEKIHLGWQQTSPENRLLIFRPGVIFGPGEGGNVTRLVRSLVKGYFVYVGNRETRKAGGYVKELCCAIAFSLEHQTKTGEPALLLNFSADPAPSMQTFVETICRVAGIQRKPLSIPRPLLMAGSHTIGAAAKALGIDQPINPVRMRKLFRSTNIDPKGLRDLGYPYRYTLDQAFEDWKADSPVDFAR